MKNKQVHRCPSDKDNKWQTEGTSYQYGLAPILCTPPSQPIDSPWGMEPTVFPLDGDFTNTWHNNGSNVLYADGHVKMKSKQ